MTPPAWLGRRFADSDLRHDANIFTLLRWLLASAVIFSHSFSLTGSGGDPSTALLPFPVSRLAVLLFFSLSGFLVTGSLVKRGVAQFFVARLVRLFPGLLVMLVVSAGFVAVWYPEAARTPEFGLYLLRNSLLLSDGLSVPHAFPTNPMPEVVNGSLWTLRHEIRCYVALAAVGALGLLSYPRLLLALFGAALIAHLLVPIDAIPSLHEPRSLGISFAAGAMAYLWRSHLHLSWPLGIACVVGALALPGGEPAQVATALAAAYLVLVAAFRVPGSLHRIGATVPDYSYGIYIYAFVVQQALIAAGVSLDPYVNGACTLALTIPFAAASWHFVEKPALGLKSHWIKRFKWQSA